MRFLEIPADSKIPYVILSDSLVNRRDSELCRTPRELLNAEQLNGLGQFLSRHNQAFSLEPGERGETDLVQLEIDTQTATPKRQSARRMPFAVRQEVARHLKEMQEGA